MLPGVLCCRGDRDDDKEYQGQEDSKTPDEDVVSDLRQIEKNGFVVRSPDPDLIEVREDYVAAFSLPEEALAFEPQEDVIWSRFGGSVERTIHCNVKLSEEERLNLEKLQLAAKAQNSDFLPSVSINATRYLSNTHGNIEEALALMDEAQRWRTRYSAESSMTNECVQEAFQTGAIYFTGRDFCLRPTLVVRVRRMPRDWRSRGGIHNFTRLLIFCTEYMIHYMCVAGRCETMCVVVDLEGISSWDIPVYAIKDMYRVLSKIYTGRVNKFFIVHMSPVLAVVVGLVQAFLSERQQRKLTFVHDLQSMMELWAPGQLEEDLGGSLPMSEVFFPFPIQPGPYGIGAEPDSDARPPPGLHRAFTKNGLRGQLWNYAASDAQNRSLEYSSRAMRTLGRNKIKRWSSDPSLSASVTSSRYGAHPRAKTIAQVTKITLSLSTSCFSWLRCCLRG